MGPGGAVSSTPQQSHIHEIAFGGATSPSVKIKVAQRCPVRRSTGQRL